MFCFYFWMLFVPLAFDWHFAKFVKFSMFAFLASKVTHCLEDMKGEQKVASLLWIQPYAQNI